MTVREKYQSEKGAMMINKYSKSQSNNEVCNATLPRPLTHTDADTNAHITTSTTALYIL